MLKNASKIYRSECVICITFICSLIACKRINTQENIDSKFVFKKSLNGKIQIMGALINEKKEGFWVELNDSGKVVSQNIYLHDSLTGESINYYDDGTTIASKGVLVNNKREGDWIFYYSNTKIAEKGAFVKGLRSGTWEYYLEDGRLNRKVLFNVNGKIEILNNHLLPPTPDQMPSSNSDSNNRAIVTDSLGRMVTH